MGERLDGRYWQGSKNNRNGIAEMLGAVKTLWKNIRRLSGDDAYERYLQRYQQTPAQQHHAEQHHDATTLASASTPLSREEFFKHWQAKKWQGIKRCC